MSRTNFQYELSNIDMKNLYTDMLCYGMDWPEVIVVKQNEDGSNVLRKEMENGNHLIYLKNDEDMFETWAMCKYKNFRGRRRRAEKWLLSVRKREPKLFAHWSKMYSYC